MMKRVRTFVLLGILGLTVMNAACSSTSGQAADIWPTMSALPVAAPTDLEQNVVGDDEAAQRGARLRAGSDGFVYAVGLEDAAEPGQMFLGRYPGDWPIADTPRPALAAGRLVKRYPGGVGLVHLSYQLPESDIDGLSIDWVAELDKTSGPNLGGEGNPSPDALLSKGLGLVESVGEAGSRELTLSLGKEDGVRKGDFYALLALSEKAAASNDAKSALQLQLSRRLTGICMIQELQDTSATCRLWGGSKALEQLARPQKGQQALFLEHTFGAAPRQGVIQVAAIKGADEQTRGQIVDAMRGFLDTVTEPHATVSTVDVSLDATAVDFYRLVETVDPVEMVQLVIGATVKAVDGEDHLFINYGGVGAASGPGMVAAPPRGGVDLGPVDQLNPTTLQNFAATVWAGMLVYRGQTSEALVQLHQMLTTPTLTGPLRWHARDQYAMRWGALGNYREALWLVLQDEAIGARDQDPEHRLNAMGTRVRLYDFLDLPERALQAAKLYLADNPRPKSEATWRSAMGMYAEMLMNAGKVDPALAVLKQLQEACPDGCKGDLNSYIASVFWRVPQDQNDVRDRLLKHLVDNLDERETDQVAALRLYQGLTAMRSEDFPQALIAFLEAERLYKKLYSLNGQARALYFAFMADLGRREPQSAYDHAMAAQKLHMKLNDFRGTAELFEHMSALYTNPEFLENPGPYLGAARQVLSGAVEASIALGDLGATGEALMSLGSFQLKIGLDAQAVDTLGQAAAFGVAATRFDVAALSHLYGAAIARKQGDPTTFRREIAQAKIMAALSEDPAIIQAVEEMLQPQASPEIPTQLL